MTNRLQKFVVKEAITVKSTSNKELPTYSFTTTYLSKGGQESKLWGGLILRYGNPRYILFLYLDDDENFSIYLPIVKAMFKSFAID